jgi:hypothetical protein
MHPHVIKADDVIEVLPLSNAQTVNGNDVITIQQHDIEHPSRWCYQLYQVHCSSDPDLYG